MSVITDILKKREKMLDTHEAAEYLQIKPSTLYVWRCKKRYNIPYIKVGRLVKYKVSDLDDFIARRTISDKYGE